MMKLTFHLKYVQMVYQLIQNFQILNCPKTVQLGGFLFGPPIQPIKEIKSLVNSITSSLKKELKNISAKKLNDILVDAGLNIIG